MDLEKYLEDLERRIDADAEEALLAEWRSFVTGGFRGDIFSPRRPRSAPPSLEWPKININDAISDFDAMALHQLRACSESLEKGDGRILCVRSNYGTGIMSSLFGADLFVMDRAADTLPTTRPVGGREAILKILDAGAPDMRRGLGGRVLDMGEYFVRLMLPYPKVSKYVHIYHPDLQGPIDVCELLWGSELFLALVDDADLVKSFLELITDTYIRFMRKWMDAVGATPGPMSVHWSLMHRGTVLLRDDSAMNLSPAMFDEFVAPYDGRILREFGGGAVHFCGKGDHYIDRLAEIEGVYAVNLSQPDYNDMEKIYRHTVDHGIMLLALDRKEAEEAIARGRPLHGRVHCW
ncbi:MAG: uroporphyrinogen decarboxylase family protein [Planctomycetota bacterium]|nr:uroporphyrinogen decarboxylase family protein [Planctomycetota bacterium]